MLVAARWEGRTVIDAEVLAVRETRDRAIAAFGEERIAGVANWGVGVWLTDDTYVPKEIIDVPPPTRELVSGDHVLAIKKWPYNFPARVVGVEDDRFIVQHEGDGTRWSMPRGALIDPHDANDLLRLEELAHV